MAPDQILVTLLLGSASPPLGSPNHQYASSSHVPDAKDGQAIVGQDSRSSLPLIRVGRFSGEQPIGFRRRSIPFISHTRWHTPIELSPLTAAAYRGIAVLMAATSNRLRHASLLRMVLT